MKNIKIGRKKMSKKVLVPLARGFEELEFVSIVDILRRAGADVVVASLDKNLLVKGAHGINMQADICIDSVNISDFDAISLAGGYEGMINLKNNAKILEFIQILFKEKKLVSAICASPIVLNEAGVLSKKFTCYPGCEQGLNAEYEKSAVVLSDNIITGAGPALGVKFALALVRYLYGDEVYQRLYKELLMDL